MPNYKPIPESVISRPDDFWSRVDVDMYDTDACFPWKGRVNQEGYGLTGGGFYAHRVAFTLAKGPIAEGMTVDHLCQRRACCNPAHLEVVSASENIKRRRESTINPSKYRPRKRTADRYQRRRDRGLCIVCNMPPLEGKSRCAQHHAAHIAGSIASRARKRAAR